ncbi:aldehyde oxidase GLOX [Aristolochia californica]|uniref:aldehyde oxidase GLOX n=1 Tax=Aristolochia californica TaxID=171875 RepID=UPI0035E13D40
MHMQLLHTDQIVMFDRTDFGPSNLSLPAGLCRIDPDDVVLKTDCTAHSLIYSVESDSFRPLYVQTDTWCSSGAVLPNGTLLQTGGYNDGERAVRMITPCDFCDWFEMPGYLSVRRWYSTNQILPDGRVIVVGGRRQFSYEFFPRAADGSFIPLQFLQETHDKNQENNLYPFLHLLPDGNLFVFANTRAILLDYVQNRVLREYPSIPGDEPRNYPSSGSSVLLPLRLDASVRDDGLVDVEIMICGGAPRGAFRLTASNLYAPAVDTCGRLRVTDQDPRWAMERMPTPRVMGDMLLLPTADILIINGAGNGTSGWELARNPVLTPVQYGPYEPPGSRFRVLLGSPIPRMYHSCAIVVGDGRVLVGGSNPHVYYNFTNVMYPTELSLESFSPPYLASRYAEVKPSIVSTAPSDFLTYRQLLTVDFNVPATLPGCPISLTLLYPSFTTHSLSMNQRLLVLKIIKVTQILPFAYQVTALGPPSPTVAPPGYYMLFVVHAGIPSRAAWLRIQ